MFTWGQNHFMEPAVSFGMLAICSHRSLCAMWLRQCAPRLLIRLPNGAGGEILCWAVAPGGQGPRLIHLVSHTQEPALRRQPIHIEWKSLYIHGHTPWCPGIKCHQTASGPSYCPALFFFWAIIVSCQVLRGLYYLFIISFPCIRI